jgi:hypothetical protein
MDEPVRRTGRQPKRLTPLRVAAGGQLPHSGQVVVRTADSMSRTRHDRLMERATRRGLHSADAAVHADPPVPGIGCGALVRLPEPTHPPGAGSEA